VKVKLSVVFVAVRTVVKDKCYPNWNDIVCLLALAIV